MLETLTPVHKNVDSRIAKSVISLPVEVDEILHLAREHLCRVTRAESLSSTYVGCIVQSHASQRRWATLANVSHACVTQRARLRKEQPIG